MWNMVYFTYSKWGSGKGYICCQATLYIRDTVGSKLLISKPIFESVIIAHQFLRYHSKSAVVLHLFTLSLVKNNWNVLFAKLFSLDKTDLHYKLVKINSDLPFKSKLSLFYKKSLIPENWKRSLLKVIFPFSVLIFCMFSFFSVNFCHFFLPFCSYFSIF